jgi:predicted nucleotidyltransferase
MRGWASTKAGAQRRLDCDARLRSSRDSCRHQFSSLDSLQTVVSNSSAAIRLEAEKAARSLADGISGVEGILLFGSVARGDPGSHSDIDLMVVSSAPLSSTLTRALLHEYPRVSLVTHTWDSLQRAQIEDWSFFVHLREEGELLFGDGQLVKELAKVKCPPAESWRATLCKELKSLSRFDDLSIFGGHYTFALAHIFTSARYTCMLDNTAAGEIAFDRDTAFDVFSQRHCDLVDEVACIRKVWPFQARTQGKGVELPFASEDAEMAANALTSAQRIVRSTIDG